MVHNNVSLTVSQDEATKADDEAKRRLLQVRKLSLVVDLDQTIIHATVDPTVGDWQKDQDNPNYEAVKDVRAFLLDDDIPGKPGCWYYIKLRPGLAEFLENISKLYELHIYTMGTRAYAKNIAHIIDPHERIFGDRILSRTESGSMTVKSLQRLFPVDTKMVVIIDDRGDVWKWSPNLIKVTPYDFFVGIGDINSSFLPKKPGPRPSPNVAAVQVPQLNGSLEEDRRILESETNGTTNQQNGKSSDEALVTPLVSNISPLEQLVAMGGSDDSTTREAQTSSQQETINKQVKEQPLLQKQRQLEAEDAAIDSSGDVKKNIESGSISSSLDDPSESERHKHNLLHDNDHELFQLEESLQSVHAEFFSLYEKEQSASAGGRLGELRGAPKRKAPSDTSDLDLVPDIKRVLPAVKARVLAKLVIVFSGVVPLGMDVGSTDIGILARSFGAQIDDKITRLTTHLIAAKNRTSKVDAAKKSRILIVTPQWLMDSMACWVKKDEKQYLLDPTEGGRNLSIDDANEDDILSESEEVAADEDENETDDDIGRVAAKPDLKIQTNTPTSEAGDGEPDIDFDKLDNSPVGGTHDDWADMNKEAEEFFGELGSDSDDDYGTYNYDDGRDGDSVASGDSATSSKNSVRGMKRGREESVGGGESDEEGVGKVKKRQAVGNALSSLSQTTNVEDLEDEASMNGINGDINECEKEAVTRDDKQEAEVDDDDDGWDEEMARDFEEEMLKRQREEEHGEG